MILFVGVSGAGKGTQSERLSHDIHYAYLSTGDILRMYASPQQKAKMLQGELLSDGEMIATVDDALRRQEDPNKLILDGFPRTTTQAEWLLGATAKHRFTIEAVVHLIVPPEIVRSRLAQRGRPDDTPSAITARLAWYEQHTKPVLDLFKASGVLVIEVDGSAGVDAVYAIIKEKLGLSAPTKE